MVATVLLLGLLSVAATTDLVRHKIYNWTTYPGILAAWGLNGLGTLLGRAALVDWETLEALGWIGLADSLLGFAACGFVLLVCFVLFHVKGGDVKLLAMMGAVLGADRGITAMLWTFVLGGCAGLIALVWRLGPATLLRLALRQLGWLARWAQPGPLTTEERTQFQSPLYLAPCALAATVIVEFSLVERFL